MSPFGRGLRQALTIARRDLTATVMTPTFILFLLAPLLMLGFALIGGMGASTVAGSGEKNQRIVILAPAAQSPAILAADRQLRSVFSVPGVRPPLVIETPAGDARAQAREMMDRTDIEATAILSGPLDRPHILYVPSARSEANFLAQLAEQTLRIERSGSLTPLSTPELESTVRAQASTSGQSQVAYFAALGVFLLTVMLSGQAVGAMAEERSNKVIEVLAAAVPLESVFFGKLLGAFGTALLFVAFWGTLLTALPRLMPDLMAVGLTELGAAVGPVFPLLFLAYFTTAYLLLSAVFLGVGALASTQRELQMLSLPITIVQVAVLGFATYGAAHPESWLALAAEVFPLSSPSAMAARAANAPELWPHLLALAWQALWVGIVVAISARLFRRGVLKSGSPKRRSARRKTAGETPQAAEAPAA
ncbi:MAG: ABC transporter permease [Sphingomonas sp.]